MGLPMEMKAAVDEMVAEMKVAMMKKLEEICRRLEEKVEKLEAENSSLKSRLDSMEKYERGKSLELHNIPEKENENLVETVRRVAAKMQVEITERDIDSAYRIPVSKEQKKNGTIPRIHVRFVRRDLKKLLYSLKYKHPVTHQSLELSSSGKVYIHESLPKHTADLFYRARDKVREASYKFIWTRNMQIYVKYNESSKPINIRSDEDLNKIIAVPARNLRSASKSS